MEDTPKLSPFDFVGSITDSKKDLIVDDETEKQYNAFIVNRQLSYFQDTVLFANEMNLKGDCDKKLQFDFLRLGINKRKRFSKWTKVEKDDDIDLLVRVYGYSKDKARTDLKLLKPDELEKIRARATMGGLKRR
jgi:hypothetical protein